MEQLNLDLHTQILLRDVIPHQSSIRVEDSIEDFRIVEVENLAKEFNYLRLRYQSNKGAERHLTIVMQGVLISAQALLNFAGFYPAS